MTDEGDVTQRAIARLRDAAEAFEDGRLTGMVLVTFDNTTGAYGYERVNAGFEQLAAAKAFVDRSVRHELEGLLAELDDGA